MEICEIDGVSFEGVWERDGSDWKFILRRPKSVKKYFWRLDGIIEEDDLIIDGDWIDGWFSREEGEYVPRF
jgi:hypothetical protein